MFHPSPPPPPRSLARFSGLPGRAGEAEPSAAGACGGDLGGPGRHGGGEGGTGRRGWGRLLGVGEPGCARMDGTRGENRPWPGFGALWAAG